MAFALALLSRLPQLCGGHCYPDGDESVLGLMALNWIDHGRIPVFFWGQAYGFSTLEAGLVAAGYKLFAYGPLTVKAAMLPLWAAGIWMQTLAIRRFAGARAAWLGLLLMIVCPAWAGWSLKARGGYLTAYLLFGVLLWLVAVVWHGRLARDFKTTGETPVPLNEFGGWRAAAIPLALGAVTVMIGFSQALWIPPALPFLALWLAGSRRRLKDLGGFALGCGLAALPMIWALLHQRIVYSPPLQGGVHPWQALLDLPERLYTHFTGAYFWFMQFSVEDWRWTAANSLLWSVLLGGACALALAQWVRRRRYGFAEAALLGILANLACSLAANYDSFALRYLLPVSGLLAVLLGAQLSRAWDGGRRLHAGAFLLVLTALILGAFNQAEWQMPPNSPPTMTLTLDQRIVDGMIRDLRGAGIRDVYCLDVALPYRIMLTTREQMMGRWLLLEKERHLPYALAVERARLAGRPTALIIPGPAMKKVNAAAEKLKIILPAVMQKKGLTNYIFTDPPPELLRELKFELPTNSADLERLEKQAAYL